MHSPRETMIVAIDGPSGVGKSTVARLVARRLGVAFLDTGAMYRAWTLAALRAGVDPDDAAGCEAVARRARVEFDDDGRVWLDGEPGEPAIRRDPVTRHVSAVSAHAGVRALGVARQRELAAELGGVVAEGRDMTTVVFPDAEHKFFLTATPATRARRRARDLGEAPDVEAVRVDLERRDAADSGREVAPLRHAPDAELVETDALSAEQVADRIVARVRGEGA